jgi:superfamily II DNA or RNA helicase
MKDTQGSTQTKYSEPKAPAQANIPAFAAAHSLLNLSASGLNHPQPIEHRDKVSEGPLAKKARFEIVNPSGSIAKETIVQNSLVSGASLSPKQELSGSEAETLSEKVKSEEEGPLTKRVRLEAVRRPDHLQYDPESDQFLRPLQKETMSCFLQALNQQDSPQGICVMPTGSGKTAMIAKVISILQQTPVKKILIVVPTLNLLKQTIQKINEYHQSNPELGLGKILPVGSFSSLKKDIRVVTVITYMSWTRQNSEVMKKVQSGVVYHPDLEVFNSRSIDTAILFDEVHRISSKAISKILQSYVHTPRIMLGFSASAKSYKLAIPILRSTSMQECIDQGMLAPICFVDLDFSAHKAVKDMRRELKITGHKEITEEQQEGISKFQSQQIEMNLTIAQYLEHHLKNKDEKAMIFTKTQAHADTLAAIFNEYTGLRTVAYHGAIKSADAALSIGEFDRPFCVETNPNPVRVCVSCGKLDEGYDNPAVKHIIDTRVYVERERRLVQGCGRATRIYKGRVAVYVRVKLLINSTKSRKGQLNPRKLAIVSSSPVAYYGCDDATLPKIGDGFELVEQKGIVPMTVRLRPPKGSVRVIKHVKGLNPFTAEEALLASVATYREKGAAMPASIRSTSAPTANPALPALYPSVFTSSLSGPLGINSRSLFTEEDRTNVLALSEELEALVNGL